MNPFEQQFTRLSPSARQRFLRKRVERFAAHYQRAEAQPAVAVNH